MIKRTWKHAAKGYLILVPFLLVIVWLLIASALADQHGQSGVANSETAPDESLVCSNANAIPAKKRLYFGEYTDLNLYQKFRIKTAPIVNQEALKHAAIAYTYRPDELFNAVESNGCWNELSHMILDGKLAIIVQEEPYWRIVSSPYIMSSVATRYEDLVHYNSDEPEYSAWVQSWHELVNSSRNAGPDEGRIGEFIRELGFRAVVIGSETSVPILAMGVEEHMFGAETAGRVVTWDGEVNVPSVQEPE